MQLISRRFFVCSFFVLGISCPVNAQTGPNHEDEQFGPVVRAYLGYLRNEQEVVDDRVSRREISRGYYQRNSNRIHALRATAIRIAKETNNDFLPELEAVAGDEFGTLFEHPPKPSDVHVGEVVGDTFRFLGTVKSVELFYVFARLDPAEQSERRKGSSSATDPAMPASKPPEAA